MFYGQMIDFKFISHVAEHIHNELTELYKGEPITYDSNTFILSPDLTIHIWGQPSNIHAWVIEVTNYLQRTLN